MDHLSFVSYILTKESAVKHPNIQLGTSAACVFSLWFPIFHVAAVTFLTHKKSPKSRQVTMNPLAVTLDAWWQQCDTSLPRISCHWLPLTTSDRVNHSSQAVIESDNGCIFCLYCLEILHKMKKMCLEVAWPPFKCFFLS